MNKRIVTGVCVSALVLGLIAVVTLPGYGQNERDEVMNNEQETGKMMEMQDMSGAMANENDRNVDDDDMMMRRGMGRGMMMEDGKMMHHRGMMGYHGMMDGKGMNPEMMKRWRECPYAGPMMMMWHMKMASRIMDVVQQYTDIADDEDASAVAAILGAEHYFKNTDEYTAFLEKNLKQAGDDTIRRAIQMKLAEVYAKSGDEATRAKSIEMMQRLIDNN